MSKVMSLNFILVYTSAETTMATLSPHQSPNLDEYEVVESIDSTQLDQLSETDDKRELRTGKA